MMFYLTTNTTVTWHWGLTDLLMTNQVLNVSTNYRAADTITAGKRYRIESPGRVTFSAGGAIRLLPPFAAATGSVFRAVAEP
jgi:hypothetical protein